MQRSMFFDRLAIDAVNRAAEVRDYASGKSINVARVAHQLGKPVIATGFVGGDRGAFLRRELDRENIAHDFVTVTALTRLCTTIVDRAMGTATELVEESRPVGLHHWDELMAKVQLHGADAEVWVLSGSLPPGAPQDFYAQCLEVAARYRSRVILDARAEPLQRALHHRDFIAKLNGEELSATVGRPLNDDDALLNAMDQTRPADGAIIITRGSAGVLASDGAHRWRVTPPRIKAISAVGSGDAFAAGLAVALSEHRSLPDALKLAAACGAANAMTPWAGYIHPSDIQELQAAVNVQAL